MTRTRTRTALIMIRRMETLMGHQGKRKDNASSALGTLLVTSASRGANILLDIFESIPENDHSSVIAADAFRA